MSNTQHYQTQFYLDQLKPLVGGVIENPVRTGEDEFGDEFFGLTIRCKDGKARHLLFLADDEGNGPGSFEIVDSERDNPRTRGER